MSSVKVAFLLEEAASSGVWLLSAERSALAAAWAWGSRVSPPPVLIAIGKFCKLVL